VFNRGAVDAQVGKQVKQKFLDELCGPDKDTRFIVGTILAHPSSWVVIGLFYPKKDVQGLLF
jgi:hypothetical protein